MKFSGVFLFAIIACNPIADAVDKASDQCQTIINEQIPKIEDQIWNECTNYYEMTVLPQIEDRLHNIINELSDLINMKLQDLEKEVLVKFGCFEDPTNPSGWNCSKSTICYP